MQVSGISTSTRINKHEATVYFQDGYGEIAVMKGTGEEDEENKISRFATAS